MMLWIGVVLMAVIAAYYFYPEQKLPENAAIDKIEVFKSQRKMDVYSEGKLLKTYTISLGKNPIGKKEFEGDFKTPEGIYTINERNPNSSFHKNLGISYPNKANQAFAQQQGKPAGGWIKIHGLRNGIAGNLRKFHRFKDWTAGCIAVTNGEMDELYVSVKPNAKIHIHP